MTDVERFSERFGFAPTDREITIYRDAPQELRDATLVIAYEAGMRPSRLRELICRTLRTRRDSQNWSEGNVEWENEQLIDGCEWYEVYEIIEKIHNTDEDKFFESGEGKGREYFANEINKFFQKSGIGWQLVDAQLQIRGAESFETSVGDAKMPLSQLAVTPLSVSYSKQFQTCRGYPSLTRLGRSNTQSQLLSALLVT